jgi:hypothetical protein
MRHHDWFLALLIHKNMIVCMIFHRIIVLCLQMQSRKTAMVTVLVMLATTAILQQILVSKILMEMGLEMNVMMIKTVMVRTTR